MSDWDWYRRVQRRRAIAEGIAFFLIPALMLGGLVAIVWKVVIVIGENF